MSEQVDRPTFAKTWRCEPGVGLVIDEQVFPWYVLADGPMVEPHDRGVYILWLPILVEGDLPQYGRPCGEPVPEPTPPAPEASAGVGEGVG